MGKVVCVSGFFDPLHYGHVDYLRKAKELAREGGSEGTLWVIVNNDKQAEMKKGKAFMPVAERVKMVRALRMVDAVLEAPDADESVVMGIKAISPDVFAIGLDEGPEYMRAERGFCFENQIQVVCPLGARIQSSSWLLDQAKNPAK